MWTGLSCFRAKAFLAVRLRHESCDQALGGKSIMLHNILLSRQRLMLHYRTVVASSRFVTGRIPTHSRCLSLAIPKFCREQLLRLSWHLPSLFPCFHLHVASASKGPIDTHTSTPLTSSLRFNAVGSDFLAIFLFGLLGFVSPGPKTSEGRS